jgi:hypothetical protein
MRVHVVDGGEVRPILPLVRCLAWRCHVCEMPLSAVTEAGLLAAMDDHAAYLNATADRTVDPHFAEVRVNALLAS